MRVRVRVRCGEGRASTGEDLEAEERVSRGVSPLPSKALG